MTKRYFYTDPLAAAWMAKHFGMMYLMQKHNSTEVLAYIDSSLMDYSIYENMSRRGVGPRFFVHPDSEHLLEPQVGDLAKVWGPDGDNYYYWSEEWYELRNANLMSRYGFNGKQIIRRNGIAFMWPESEEA